ncbi:MAG TPA: phosphoribosylglycinamide formyltransferase [Methanoregulaceae archaeon]|nr:phosphoribosylglycinamide formyltransferase [Methanoregulaceae archaeon]
MNPASNPQWKKIIVLASGRGSNFQAIIDALIPGDIPAVCIRLITDNPGAYAIERAKQAGIPVTVVDYGSFSSKKQYEEALLEILNEYDPDLVLLAGYMRIVGNGIVHRFHGRMINIHPALLPSFPGLHSQQQALDYGVRVSGCTVHFVDEHMDSGPIIIQSCVPVLPGDDEEALADRILLEEHRCFPLAVKLFCTDRLRIRGRVVEIIE